MLLPGTQLTKPLHYSFMTIDYTRGVYETRAPKVVQSNTGSAGFIKWKLDYTSLFSLKGFFLSQLSGIPICIFYLDKGE